MWKEITIKKNTQNKNSADPKPRKILILYTSAGSGHKAATMALKTAWEEQCPQDEIIIKDILTYTSGIFSFIYSRGYMTLVGKLPFLWRVFYYKDEEVAKFKPPNKFGWFIRWLALGKFVRKMKAMRPDIIISTHFFCSDGVVILKRRNYFDFKFAIITTDYGLHSAWLAPGTDQYFVPLPSMKAELLTIKDYLGVEEENIEVTGIPISPKFIDLPPKDELRRKFNLKPGIFTILLFRNVFTDSNFDLFIKYLIQVGHPLQLIMLAGREWPIPDKLKKTFIENNINYRIFGYIDFMEELMRLSDLVVSKTGGLTTSECLAAGAPMGIYSPYPGQEERNAEFLMEKGAGFKITQLASLHYHIAQMIENPDIIKNMSEAAKRISNPTAAYKIVKRLNEMGVAK